MFKSYKMKRLRIIIFSFILILVVGIFLTNTLINTKLENGVHKIELENEDSKSVEVSIETLNDTLKISDKDSSISEIEKNYVKTIFSFLESNIEMRSGWYKFTF